LTDNYVINYIYNNRELTQNNKAMTRSNGTLKEKIKHAQNTLQSLKTQYVVWIYKFNLLLLKYQLLLF